MAEIRKQRPDVEVRLVKGSGGQFEVTVDGRPIFSKKQQGRFPETREILESIPVA